MDYTRKLCPICREEFFVLENLNEKVKYCTLKCFLESDDSMKEFDLTAPLDLIEPF